MRALLKDVNDPNPISGLIPFAPPTDPTQFVLYCLRADVDTPAALLDRLTDMPSALVRQSVAPHPNCSRETLADLAQDPDPRILVCVAVHPNISFTTVNQLAQSEHLQVALMATQGSVWAQAGQLTA